MGHGCDIFENSMHQQVFLEFDTGEIIKGNEGNSGILRYRISFKAKFEFIDKVRTSANIN